MYTIKIIIHSVRKRSFHWLRPQNLSLFAISGLHSSSSRLAEGHNTRSFYSKMLEVRIDVRALFVAGSPFLYPNTFERQSPICSCIDVAERATRPAAVFYHSDAQPHPA